MLAADLASSEGRQVGASAVLLTHNAHHMTRLNDGSICVGQLADAACCWAEAKGKVARFTFNEEHNRTVQQATA